MLQGEQTEPVLTGICENKQTMKLAGESQVEARMKLHAMQRAKNVMSKFLKREVKSISESWIVC